jgi:hypothetical protein
MSFFIVTITHPDGYAWNKHLAVSWRIAFFTLATSVFACERAHALVPAAQDFPLRPSGNQRQFKVISH